MLAKKRCWCSGVWAWASAGRRGAPATMPTEPLVVAGGSGCCCCRSGWGAPWGGRGTVTAAVVPLVSTLGVAGLATSGTMAGRSDSASVETDQPPAPAERARR
ncbi:hypothetical protein BDY21DRAFT_349623 [Lineolata rhizophorae]|uniref:Uncharacterized protein n=1 Tax=Lineolata rhizophorae TaxID=578093 RepID=A0A6A6NUU2_9PEZI|nr:hypothetical protein BDY21DRAFT_349623 [Lineolata rhizophorae]